MKTAISCLSCLILVSFIVTGKYSYAATYTITSGIDYGTVYGAVTSGSSVQPEITIINTGTAVLQTGGIADTNPVSAPFSIPVNNCANVLIQPGEQCSFMVLFSPTSTSSFSDSFNVDIVSDNSSNPVTLSGQGGPAVNEPDISVSFTSIDFGQVDVLDSATAPASSPYTFSEYVQNAGKLDLNISSITIGGTDASDVAYTGTCTSTITLSPGHYCTLGIYFTPTTIGDKYAEVSIASDDPDEKTFIISIRGKAIGEDDGVPASIEDAGPNNGDGNNDGLLDSKQNNVTTLVDAQGDYVTYQTTQGILFRNMALSQQTSASGMPGELVNGAGLFDFTIEGLTPGQSVQVGIILPAGTIPGGYYIYGPTTDNPTDHWYNFAYDGLTGASILGNTTFTTGTAFIRSVVMVAFQDGGRGDSDLTADGIITVKSGLAAPGSSSSRIGSVGMMYILLILTSIVCLRKRNE